MSQNLTSLPEDLEHLQQRLTEFRSTHRGVRPASVQKFTLRTQFGVPLE